MITIPREICCNPSLAMSHEWLVTNGLGGYASSSISGANTRRYHGLLVAALRPPSGRTVLLSKLDEELEVDGSTYKLGTNEYESGTIHPDGYLYLERVEQDGMIPTFFYRSSKFALAKTIWMENGENTVYVRYKLRNDSQPVNLTLLPLCTYRDAHYEARASAEWHWEVRPSEGHVQITARPGAVALHLMTVPLAEFVPLDLWYWRFKHRQEQERGLDCVEDLFAPGLVRIRLEPGQSFTAIATVQEPGSVLLDVDAALERERTRLTRLVSNCSDSFERDLKAAADQFIVKRAVNGVPLKTVIAGYHWFGDWGRDTMIALEGLTLATGRYAEAKSILRAFAKYVDQGMLPNRFPEIAADSKDVLVEYNTVDATLWYFHAIGRYLAITQDEELLRELFPVLASIVDCHLRGTRYGIAVDANDGLLRAGVPGVQLTWMDAKAGDWVVTPRIGKPVEVNALWYHALRLMEEWSPVVGGKSEQYRDLAERAHVSFDKFWFGEGGYLYDVVDGPDGNDASLRPNQLFALSLSTGLVPIEKADSILQVVRRELLTPVGLRTLSPRDPHYISVYHGDQRQRDAAYHQGIIWPWLIGAYVDACLAVYGDAALAREALASFPQQMEEAGLGTLSEIHEAQPPFRPVGCIAQAWSIAEVLRAYNRVRRPSVA